MVRIFDTYELPWILEYVNTSAYFKYVLWLTLTEWQIVQLLTKLLLLTLFLLNMTCPVLANSADPDQLASEEANWSGSALFAISI